MPHCELKPPVTQSGENLKGIKRERVCVGRIEREQDYLTIEREKRYKHLYILKIKKVET
jgi:hypothetical protein